MEAFYKAINKGDFDNAEKYLGPNSSIESFLPDGENRSSFVNGVKEAKVQKEVSMARGEAARVVVRLILRPELKERLKKKAKSSFFHFGDSDCGKWEKGTELMLGKVNGKWMIIQQMGGYK